MKPCLLPRKLRIQAIETAGERPFPITRPCAFDTVPHARRVPLAKMSHSHSHDNGHSHSHGAAAVEHGHTHEVLDHPGKFANRDLPTYEGRNWKERAFTVGIGGPVGSGKTALTLALCKLFRDRLNLGVVTNDIFTREDMEFLHRNEALPDKGRIRAIETGKRSFTCHRAEAYPTWSNSAGGCPHAAIREDISANLGALEELQADYGCELLLVESGGDNLAANYSRELADYIIYVCHESQLRRPHH